MERQPGHPGPTAPTAKGRSNSRAPCKASQSRSGDWVLTGPSSLPIPASFPAFHRCWSQTRCVYSKLHLWGCFPGKPTYGKYQIILVNISWAHTGFKGCLWAILFYLHHEPVRHYEQHGFVCVCMCGIKINYTQYNILSVDKVIKLGPHETNMLCRNVRQCSSFPHWPKCYKDV